MTEVKFVEVTRMRVIKVWWSLVWRILLFGFLAILGVGLFLGLFLAPTEAEFSSVRIACNVIIILILIPLGVVITKSVLSKHYSDFKIALIAKEGSHQESQ